MQTDDLITLLSQSPRAKPPLRLNLALPVLTAVTAAMTIAILGLRPDIAAPPVGMLHKAVLLLSVLVAANSGLIRNSVPVAKSGWGQYPAIVAGALFAASLVWEWSHVPAAAIAHSFFLKNFPFCLGAVSIYGAVGSAVLTWLMRFYAPANAKAAATAIGFTAAAAGALGYSIHCPVDSPTFILIAYGLPVVWVTLLARWFVAPHIRW